MPEATQSRNFELDLCCVDQFLSACETGSTLLWRMIRAGVDINIPRHNGDTGLITATRFRKKSSVSTLLSHNADRKDKNPTFRADSNGVVLKDKYVNINQVNNDGQTALMVAAGMANNEILKLFIDHKGVQKLDVNIRDIDSKTALHYAVTSGSLECLELLLKVRGIEIDDDLESYATGKNWGKITELIAIAREKSWKKTRDFEKIVLKACNGDLCKLPEPWEPDWVQVKKSMDLIKVMGCLKMDILVQFNDGKMPEVKWLEYPEKFIFNTINSLLSFYNTEDAPTAAHENQLGKLQEKLASNHPPNLHHFLNISLVKLMNNTGGMVPTFIEGDGFDAKEILRSMDRSEQASLIKGLAKMSDVLPKYPSEKFNAAVKFYVHGVDRSLGVPWEFDLTERQSHFQFCNNVQNFHQDAFDINQTYWEKISSCSSNDVSVFRSVQNVYNVCCETEEIDKDGCVLNAFFDYILNKIETLSYMGKMEEARELCLRIMDDLKQKTVYMRKGKEIKLSPNEVKSDLGLVIESLYVRLAGVSVHELKFCEAFEILEKNVTQSQLLEVRLETAANIHKKMRQVMNTTNLFAKETVKEDFDASKIVVNPFLENHYVDKNGKIFVESIEKALRIAKNGDTIFLKNGDYDIDKKIEGIHMVTDFEKSLTLIGESTNQTVINLYLNKCTSGEVRFKRLHVKVELTIGVNDGKLSFDSCLVDVCCEACFTFEKRPAEIDLSFCCVTNKNYHSDAITTFVLLKDPDPIIKMNWRNCYFSEFLNIIRDPIDMSLRCGFELHVDSCSFVGVKLAMIALCPPLKRESDLTYPTSIVLRNCFVEISSKSGDMFLIMNINNASHVLIENTKFSINRGDPSNTDMDKRIYTGLTFAYVQCVEITNTRIVWEGKYSGLPNLQTYLEKPPTVGLAPERDAAIQLMGVHEAIIRDSTFKGFYCGINTESVYKSVNKICFIGVYNCKFTNLAVCVLLESRFTRKSIFVLSDVTFRDSLVAIRISSMCENNSVLDVLDAKFINVATPIILPRMFTTCLKDTKGIVLSSLKMNNLTFPKEDNERPTCSRKQRRDDMIENLMKNGILDPTVSLPYLETIFKPNGDWFEISNEKDLETFYPKESRPASTSDYHSDSEESVD